MKNIDKTKIVDIIFSVIFIILLFIPALKISNAEISRIENRPLAQFHPLINPDKTINTNFGKDFDNWFKDRFFLRNKLFSIYITLKRELPIYNYQFNNQFWNKKTNYIASLPFHSNFDEKFIYRNSYVEPEIIYNIKRLDEFCKENNIKLYMMIPPFKSEVGSSLSSPVLMRSKIYIRKLHMVEQIKEQTGVKFLYPYWQIVDYSLKSDEPVYFKNDYHWTDIGAYVAYSELMKEIEKDFKNIRTTQLNEFDTFKSVLSRICPVYGFFVGYNYKSLFLNDFDVLDQEYTYLIPKNYQNVVEKHYIDSSENTIVNVYENKNNPNAPNVLMYGDSFSLNMIPGFISSFKNFESVFVAEIEKTNLSASSEIKKFKKELNDKNIKIDILVLCFEQLSKYMFLYRNGDENGF